MTDVFLERTFEPPLTPRDVIDLATLGMDCFMTHKVDWFGSLRSIDGQRLVCWFRGPDVE